MDTKLKYKAHRQRCKYRKDKLGNQIEMRLTYEQWLNVWLESGHLLEMGSGAGKYCMSRHNDTGHYEIGNVSIKLHTLNSMEVNTPKSSTPEEYRQVYLLRRRNAYAKSKASRS